MSSITFAPLLLAIFLVFAGLVTLTESRTAPSPSLKDADADDVALRIASRWARCICMHARDEHEHCAAGLCGCERFAYGGGLVEPHRGGSNPERADGAPAESV